MLNQQTSILTKRPIVIAIVGCGASGIIALHYLIAHYAKLKLHRPIRICIFEKSENLALGVAYSTDNNEHILNMRNWTIDIFSESPSHFMDWLKVNATKLHLSQDEIAPDAFLPRKIVGVYLQEILENCLFRAPQSGIDVEIIHEEVIDCKEMQTRQRVFFASTCLDVHYTILCLGNLPSTHYPELHNIPEYFSTPWNLNGTIKNSCQPIGILGASLTAIDTLFTLASSTYSPLYFISPTGRLPKVLHIRRPFTPQFVTKENIRLLTKSYKRKLRLEEIVALYKKEIEAALAMSIDWSKIWYIHDDPFKVLQTDIAKAEKGDNHWHTVIASTIPLLPLLWNNLLVRDKKTFYSQYSSLWRIYRTNIPLQNAKKVAQLFEAGRLHVIGGLRSVVYDKTDREFTISYEKNGAQESLKVAYLVDATGTGFDVARSRSDLIKNMLASGTLTPHPMGGVRVNFRTLRVIKQDNVELRRMFFFGILTKGVHLHTNILSANAVHGERVAREIIQDIRNTT